jgi:AraC-like DNA-binding protein
MGVFDGAAIFGVYQTALGFISWFVFLIINAFFFLLFVLLFSDQDIAIEVSVNNDLVKEEPSEVKCCWKKQFAELELFLYSDLTLQKTSVELNIPKYRLTQLIREEGFDSFYSFVSHYRVEKSKTLLRKLPDLHVIESVIQDSGFKSRSTFFRVFKEFAGITPGQYIKKAQDK